MKHVSYDSSLSFAVERKRQFVARPTVILLPLEARGRRQRVYTFTEMTVLLEIITE
jgi:hypothetical protein